MSCPYFRMGVVSGHVAPATAPAHSAEHSPAPLVLARCPAAAFAPPVDYAAELRACRSEVLSLCEDINANPILVRAPTHSLPAPQRSGHTQSCGHPCVRPEAPSLLRFYSGFPQPQPRHRQPQLMALSFSLGSPCLARQRHLRLPHQLLAGVRWRQRVHPVRHRAGTRR